MKTQNGHVYALIQNEQVSWVFTHTDLPEYNENDIEVVDVTSMAPRPELRWCYVEGVFTAPPALSIEMLKAQISARRYTKETQGINHDGLPIDTDRDSQALISGIALAVTLDPAYGCKWKTAIGFVELTAQQIIAITSAVRAHVQACFDREAELFTALDEGTYNDGMFDEGWPERATQ